MFSTITAFSHTWQHEIENTQKILKHLNNASLSQAIGPEGRTLGQLAWHITTTIPEMMNLTGLRITAPDPNAPVPATAKEIFDFYNKAAVALLDQVTAGWTDETLQVSDPMYGEQWKRGLTLQSLVFHQIHHRGQMTVLMRQAGLRVPGIFGPSREEWAQIGMEPPKI